MIKYIAMPAFLAAAFVPHGGESSEFDEANVFIEINATDKDAGFQGIVDGDPWRRIKLLGEDGQTLFKYKVQREAREQGFTEFQWESAEPVFDELPLSVFLCRFPAGDYTFKGPESSTPVLTARVKRRSPAE